MWLAATSSSTISGEGATEAVAVSAISTAMGWVPWSEVHIARSLRNRLDRNYRLELADRAGGAGCGSRSERLKDGVAARHCDTHIFLGVNQVPGAGVGVFRPGWV
eukprot:gene23840-30444_t